MNDSTQIVAMFARIIKELRSITDTKEQAKKIQHFLNDILESDSVECLLYDETRKVLYKECDSSVELPTQQMEGILGKTFSILKPAFYNYIRSEKLYDPEVDNPLDIRLKSQLLYPVVQNERLIAIFRISRTIKKTNNFTQHDIKMLESVESYLVNMIHTLTGKVEPVNVDQQAMSEKIKQLEEKSHQIEEEMNDTMMFLSNTVHDIRTPANSLYGFLELMEEQIEDKKLLKFIQNAKQSAEFITTLTDSILERVKYDNEKRISEIVTVNSVNFFARVGDIFSANMTSKGIHFLIQISPTIPKQIKMDKVKLKRVLINLIGNAYKFTPSGKTIEFNVEFNEKKKRLHIEVKDAGLGIEESRQKEIFKAFEQAKEDTSIHFGGTGLGLAICSQYVSDLGGELKLESQEDVGSNFFFEIPVEIVDKTVAYTPFFDRNKVITLYTDDSLCIDANAMKFHLEKCGMPSENVVISDKIKRKTTHLVVFEHKLSESVLKVAKENDIKLILFEEKLFSLSKQEKYKEYPIMSKNNYYADVLYSSVSSQHKPMLLIVEDNRLNVQLLESMLEGEYCDITVKYDGEEGLEVLKRGLETGTPFDIIFSDKNMPGMSGTEMLRAYRELELKHPNIKPIYAVSITGDADVDKEVRELYNALLPKPFNRKEVVKILKKI